MTRELEITSAANPRIRAAIALRDAGERGRTGATIVDGARELRRALDAGVDVVEAFVCDPLLAGQDARASLDALRARAVPVHHVKRAAFSKLAFGDRAEGLVAVIRLPTRPLDGLALPADPLIVVVEGVEKPGNLGAILRSADGAGADAVIAASPRTDLANPNVIRASAGTVFAMQVVEAPTSDVIAWLRGRSLRIVTTRVEAARRYTDADLTGPLAIVLGTEDEGLSEHWSGPDTEAVSLPMRGIADSLNVSVTAAILLYEALRQRDHHGTERRAK
ncbi:MAG: RNA methyltransferase [Chloroflexota bacterium]